MSRLTTAAPITAIVYASGSRIDGVLLDIAGNLTAQGLSLAGLIQRGKTRPGRSRCDMILEDLGSGSQVEISEDRGPLARGCMLAIPQLMYALELATRSLDGTCDLLVVNKFGKTEAEGGGFRTLIVEAMNRDIPILIAVPAANLESWHHFAQGIAVEVAAESLSKDPAVACHQLQLQSNSHAPQAGAPLSA
jgi:nucleoside-triphosphatase THEP1